MKKLIERYGKPKYLLAGVIAGMGLVLFCGALGWYLLTPLDPTPYLATMASGRMLDREGTPLYVALNRDEAWSLPQPYEALSPFLIQATQAAEDQRFWRHYGIDPLAIFRAAGQNLWEGGVASGASTLTMQLVKMTGRDSRSVTGKLGQALLALRLEKSTSKQDILNAYLNRAPYGMNLIGAEAAAWRYFGKSVQTLNLPEAALIAGLPKAPSRLNPLEHPKRAQARRDYVLRRMHEDGFIDAAQRDWALAVPVSAQWHDFPRHAPHLAVPLSEELARGEAITLTLDATLQRRLEAALPHYLKKFNGSITNGAVLVADVETGEILARVGSADFEYTPGGGKVDACRALRSPGSTLKPFLYGWAMTQQQLYPSEVLLDDVLDYGGYNPGNFDGNFNGPVTATEALRYSLNVPAVALLGRIGVTDFLDFLRDTGLTTVTRSAENYGLGLAIGNCEVRLEELAGLYVSVASLGRQNALHWQKQSPAPSGRPALSADVCRMLYTMLAQPFPEELSPGLVRAGGNDTQVCWKTGTSTGYHDAWTFAFNQHYLVAVWLGNNSGADARQLIGARAALPLAADIFRSLPPRATSAWPAAEPTDAAVKICSGSGLPAGPNCPDTATSMLPASIWRHRRCALHPSSQTQVAVAATRPADASAWNLASLNVGIRKGNDADVVRALSVVTPADGATYVLTGVPGGDTLKLSSSRGETESMYWYADDRYLGESRADAPIYWPLSLGSHRVTCVARDGATATASVSVEHPSSDLPVQ